jgi:hypothetical protein
MHIRKFHITGDQVPPPVIAPTVAVRLSVRDTGCMPRRVHALQMLLHMLQRDS